jgi:hypothetical protein
MARPGAERNSRKSHIRNLRVSAFFHSKRLPAFGARLALLERYAGAQ